MSAAVEKPASNRAGRPRVRADRDLVHLATPALDLIVQIRAGLISPTIELRKTLDNMLQKLEQRGEALGYKEKQLQTVKFALAAFIDETVLIRDFPLREEWERYPLQLGYVGEHLAGLTFFERLDVLMKSEADIDVVEALYVCLLLGYKGKYNIYFEEQLKTVIENVADYLRRVGRLKAGPLSPHWKVNDQPEPPAATGLPLWVKVGGGIAVGVFILIYMVFKFLISSDINAARDQLLR